MPAQGSVPNARRPIGPGGVGSGSCALAPRGPRSERPFFESIMRSAWIEKSVVVKPTVSPDAIIIATSGRGCSEEIGLRG